MRKAFLLAAAVWLMISAPALAAGPYSAEVVIKAKGSRDAVSRVFVGGQDRWRVETGAKGEATIVRLDRKMVLTILPASRSYFISPLSDEEAKPDFQASKPSLEAKVARKALGKEAIGGRPATKYYVTLSGPGQRPSARYEWLSDELGVPVKMQAVDNTWSMEYRGIKLGPQDPRLFEVPAGYAKLAIPTGPRRPPARR
jgi:hypothetical protein